MLRLLLALILAIASLPMPAMACATAGPALPIAIPIAGAVTDHAQHHAPDKAPMPPRHDCIGCISAVDWNGARVTPTVMPAAMALTARIAAMPLLPGEAPTPPPPRFA